VAPTAAPPNTVAPAPSVAASSTAAATAGPEVSDQLLTVLAPLRSGDDGTHTVTLSLQPEGLGTVQATVTFDGQQISVDLWADAASGHAALNQSLGQLHAQLGGGTDHHVTVDLAEFGSAQPEAHGGQTSDGGRRPLTDRPVPPGDAAAGAVYAGDAPASAALSAMAYGGRRVDLRL
jgi:flagellar hook-length control protein FliK